MTNVSKRQLPKHELEKLFQQLNGVIGKLDSTSANDFLYDLLGTEERIMLAKRFTIIIMLSENYTTYQIAKKLHVSTGTVKTTHKKLKAGAYNRLLGLTGKRKRDYKKIWETLDDILHLGGVLPHYNGLDRYRSLKN